MCLPQCTVTEQPLRIPFEKVFSSALTSNVAFIGRLQKQF